MSDQTGGSGITSGGVSGAVVDDTHTDAVDVFISYGSSDMALAREIRGHLESGGYVCWMAPDDVAGPKSWAEQIVDAIAACKVMLVLVSSVSNASSHVSKEVDLAIEHGKAVLPVRIEDVVPSGALRYLLALAQWIDAFPGPIGPHADEVKRRVAAIVAPDGEAPLDTEEEIELPVDKPPQPGVVPAAPTAKGRPWLKWVAAAAAVAVVAGGIAAALLIFGNGGEPYEYGDDTRLDWLWDRCDSGDMASCDAMVEESSAGTDYAFFGETCGERVVGGGGCVERGIPTEGPSSYGDDPGLDELWDECNDGDLAACDALSGQAEPDTEYARFGETCGERTDGGGECSVPGGVEAPFTYGDDPFFDELWDRCNGEDFGGCMELYELAPVGSEYEQFGGSCGGRSEFPQGCEPLFGGFDELDVLAEACAAGAMDACWNLYEVAPVGSEYEAFGLTCGGRTDGLVPCVFTYGDSPYLDELWNACANGEMEACDILYYDSPEGSEYEDFGWSCGWITEDGGNCAGS
jgi:hypothetical protein